MKLKNVMLALVVALAVSCGSKENKETAATEGTTATETPVVEEKPATTKEIITQEWMLETVDYEAAVADLPEKEKAEFKSQMAQMLPLMKGKNTYTFKTDGSVDMGIVGPDEKLMTRKGTWALSADEKTLSLTSDGQTFDLPIIEVTADKLSLQQQKLVMIYVPKK